MSVALLVGGWVVGSVGWSVCGGGVAGLSRSRLGAVLTGLFAPVGWLADPFVPVGWLAGLLVPVGWLVSWLVCFCCAPA